MGPLPLPSYTVSPNGTLCHGHRLTDADICALVITLTAAIPSSIVDLHSLPIGCLVEDSVGIREYSKQDSIGDVCALFRNLLLQEAAGRMKGRAQNYAR